MQNFLTTDTIAILRSIADAWPDGSPQRAALMAAIADVERLGKVERMKLDVVETGTGWEAFDMSCAPSCGKTARSAIDGVPE